jgi:hypothetical protein
LVSWRKSAVMQGREHLLQGYQLCKALAEHRDECEGHLPAHKLHQVRV